MPTSFRMEFLRNLSVVLLHWRLVCSSLLAYLLIFDIIINSWILILLFGL